MAVASLRYDHPAYTTPVVFSGSTTAGLNGVTTKFCAFTAMKLKQVVNAPNLALPTTAAGSQPLLYLGRDYANFQTNLGSGGNFTVTGALERGTTSPSDVRA